MKKLIAIMGEAGSGKDSLVERILAEHYQMFHKIVPCTTRPKRENETEGKEYHFLTQKEFQNYAFVHQILDQTFFKNQYYGSRLQDYSSNKVNIGVFNPAGLKQIYQTASLDLDVTVYQLNVKSKIRILRQLNREENPDVDEIARRHLADKEDFQNIDFNTIKLPNETYEDLQRNIQIIVTEAQRQLKDNND